MPEFLTDFDDRLPWTGKKKHGAVTAVEMLRGSTETDLVVVLGEAATLPAKGDVAALWKERAGQSMDPVLVAVVYPDDGQDRVVILGPDRDAVPVSAIELYTAERLVGHALEMESPTGLVAEMRRRLASLRGGVGPGFRNEGLFATHVLAQQPQRPDWQQLCQQSQPLLANSGEGLLTRLGYKFDHLADGVVLRDAKEGSRRAAAVLLLDDESMDNPPERTTAAHLPDEWQNLAYDAWATAAQHITDTWNASLATPSGTDIPPAIRQAVQHIRNHSAHRNLADADRADKAYRRGQPARVTNIVRAIMRDEDLTEQNKTDRLIELVDELGLTAPEKTEKRFAIDPSDIRLIAWMAIIPTSGTSPEGQA